MVTQDIKWERVEVHQRPGRLRSQVKIATRTNGYGKEVPYYLIVSSDLLYDLEKEIGPTYKDYKGRFLLLKSGTLVALKPSTVGNVTINPSTHKCGASAVCREIHKITHAWDHDGWVQDGMIIFKPVKETR